MPLPVGTYPIGGPVVLTGRKPDLSAAGVDAEALYEAGARWFGPGGYEVIEHSGSAGSYVYAWVAKGSGASKGFEVVYAEYPITTSLVLPEHNAAAGIVATYADATLVVNGAEIDLTRDGWMLPAGNWQFDVFIILDDDSLSNWANVEIELIDSSVNSRLAVRGKISYLHELAVSSGSVSNIAFIAPPIRLNLTEEKTVKVRLKIDEANAANLAAETQTGSLAGRKVTRATRVTLATLEPSRYLTIQLFQTRHRLIQPHGRKHGENASIQPVCLAGLRSLPLPKQMSVTFIYSPKQ